MYMAKTKQGHIITTTIRQKEESKNNERIIIIFYRTTRKDFNIGIGYDRTSGEWNQGVYDFKTEVQAIKWVKSFYKESRLIIE